MSAADRRNAIVVAIIAVVGAIAVAILNQTDNKPEAPPVAVENKAETKGSQSPAVSGAKDVDITYGTAEEKQKGK